MSPKFFAKELRLRIDQFVLYRFVGARRAVWYVWVAAVNYQLPQTKFVYLLKFPQLRTQLTQAQLKPGHKGTSSLRPT